MLYNDRIYVFEGIDVNKTNTSKNVLFGIIGILLDKRFNHLFAIHVMMY